MSGRGPMCFHKVVSVFFVVSYCDFKNNYTKLLKN